MNIWKRLAAAALCVLLLLGLVPAGAMTRARAAAEENWSVRYDPADFAGGTVSVELYDAGEGYAPAVTWSRGSGLIRADKSASALFYGGGAHYAVLQYETGGGAVGTLTDAEIAEQFELWFTAVYGAVPAVSLPEGYPEESREAALAWYASAREDAGFAAWYADEDNYGEPLPTAEELLAMCEEWYDPEYDDLDELVREAVNDFAYAYLDYSGAGSYFMYGAEEKRSVIENLIEHPEYAPAGYTPPGAAGGEAVCRVVLHRLSRSEELEGLTVDAAAFDACVPLTVSTVQTGTEWDAASYSQKPVYAPAFVYFRAGEDAIPARIAEPVPEEDEEELAGGPDEGVLQNIRFGGEVSERLTGLYPAKGQLLLSPGACLVTMCAEPASGGADEAVLDWESLMLDAPGGRVDFTTGRYYVNLTAAAPADTRSLSVQLTGGVLGTAVGAAELCRMGYSDGGFTWQVKPLKVRPGSYGDLRLVHGTATGGSEYDSLTCVWERALSAEITADTALTLPALTSEALSGELVFRSAETGEEGPFRPEEEVNAEMRLTAGDWQLTGAVWMHVDEEKLAGLIGGGEVDESELVEMRFLSTAAAYEGGEAITAADAKNFVWFRLKAPSASRTVTAVTSLQAEGIVSLRVEASALLRVGAGDGVLPVAPANFTLISAEENTLQFGWAANGEENLAGYRLYRTDAEGKHAVLTAEAAKGETALGLALDRAAWGKAPWYFVLTAVDADGDESAQSALVPVNDPALSFRGTPAWEPAGEAALRGGALILPASGGQMRLTFVPDGDLAPEAGPESVAATLHYLDVSRAGKTAAAALPKSGGYAALLPVPEDAAYLESIDFTCLLGGKEQNLGTLTMDELPVASAILLELPEDYALAAAFDRAVLRLGDREQALTRSGNAFTGEATRAEAVSARAAFYIGEREFLLSGTLAEQAHEAGRYTLAAAALPEEMRLRVELDDLTFPLSLTGWFLRGSRDMPVSSYGEVRDGALTFYLRRPAEAATYERLRLELWAGGTAYSFLCREGGEAFAEEGIPFLPGMDLTVRGEIGVEGLEDFMYLDVRGQNGAAIERDLTIRLTDSAGELHDVRWYWYTKQLDTGLLPAGERCELSVVPHWLRLGSDPLALTVLHDGSNGAAMPVLSVYKLAQVTLNVMFKTDELGLPGQGAAAEYDITTLPEVQYHDTATGAWTPLSGTVSWQQVSSSGREGLALYFCSDELDERLIDGDEGLRLLFGSEANLTRRSHLYGDGGIVDTNGRYYAGESLRLKSGQVFYTRPNEANAGLTATGLSMVKTEDDSCVTLYFGDKDPLSDAADLPAVIRGLRVAETPRIALRIDRFVEQESAVFLLRSKADGEVYRYAYELLTRSEGTLNYDLPELPYGEYDLLLLVGSGREESQLERQFSYGAEVEVPASVSGCVVKGITLSEDDALLALDLPAAPILLTTPGLQGLTLTPDKSAVLRGERVTFTVTLSCVPGGSEAERTLALKTFRSCFAIDGISASLTTADGRRVTPRIEGTEKVVLPGEGSLVSGTILVTGRIGAESGPAALDAAVTSVDYSTGRYVRGLCSVESITAAVRERTITPTAAASGRGPADAELTVRILSQSDPARTAEQTVTVGRYGYWKTLLTLPVAVSDAADVFTVRLYGEAAEPVWEGSVSYEPKGVLPAMIRLAWEQDGTRSETVAYPGENRDFDTLNHLKVVFGPKYESTVVRVELVFDDETPDANGLTPARRVTAPAMILRPVGSGLAYQYDLKGADSKTFTYVNDTLGLRYENVPYSTHYYTCFWGREFGRMAFTYDLIPTAEELALESPGESFTFPASGASDYAAGLRALEEQLTEPAAYSGSFSCELEDFAFDGIRLSEEKNAEPLSPEEDGYALAPVTQTVRYRAESSVSAVPIAPEALAETVAGFVPGEDAFVHTFTGEDSFLRYVDYSEEAYLRLGEDGDVEFVIETVWNAVLDATQVPGAGARLMGSGGLFGMSERTTQLVGGLASSGLSEGVDALLKEGGKFAAENAAKAKVLGKIAGGLGAALNVVSTGMTVKEEFVDDAEKVDQELWSEFSELRRQLDRSYSYYSGKLTCEEGGASRVQAELDAIFRRTYAALEEAVDTSRDEHALRHAGNVLVSATGFLPVPVLPAVIGYVHDGAKEVARENQRFTDDKRLWQTFYDGDMQMRRAMAGYDPTKCEPEEPDEKQETDQFEARRKQYRLVDGDGTTWPVDVHPERIIDPSGIVYEGMEANPLAGVEVSIEYWDGAAWQPWTAAEEYNDQSQSYITGANGAYRWDVPDGKWRVRYYKEGYNGGEAVYSGEMDVPPVWLDVNRNMQTAAPASASAFRSAGGVTVRFTRPVLAEDLGEKLRLEKDGAALSVSFAPVTEENGLVLTAFAASALDPAAAYTVSAAGVRTYAGTESSFTVPVDLSTYTPPAVCERVDASLESGSTVAAGSLLTLSCATPGASIWYTTDGSCPCVEGPARRLYTGPIALEEDSYLIACASAPGLEDSPTRALIYFCAAPGEKILGRARAESHAVTAAVWLDLRGVEGACEVLLAYYAGGRFLGLLSESVPDAGALESLSLAKRWTSGETLADVSVRVMLLRSDTWAPLLPAASLLP